MVSYIKHAVHIYVSIYVNTYIHVYHMFYNHTVVKQLKTLNFQVVYGF